MEKSLFQKYGGVILIMIGVLVLGFTATAKQISKSHKSHADRHTRESITLSEELDDEMESQSDKVDVDYTSDWRIDSSRPLSAQSRRTYDGDSSTLSATVRGPGTILFDWKVSSERNYDKLTFYVDGREKNSISGTDSYWDDCRYSISGSGYHEIKWVYRKDGSGSSGSDCGWIRNVRFRPDHSRR